jgi:hypothetical protein
MSKKHFQKLARAIGGILDKVERERMARLIGEVCADCNPGFNWARWNSACNVE